MHNDPEMDLIRLFAAVDEPGQGDMFVQRVSKRIRLLRFTYWALQVALAGIGIVILFFLTPWVIDLTGYVALALNVFTRSIVTMVFSPIGCILGGAAGMFVFLRKCW